MKHAWFQRRKVKVNEKVVAFELSFRQLIFFVAKSEYSSYEKRIKIFAAKILASGCCANASPDMNLLHQLVAVRLLVQSVANSNYVMVPNPQATNSVQLKKMLRSEPNSTTP